MILQPSQGGPKLAQTDYRGALDPELSRVVALCDPRLERAQRLTFRQSKGGDIRAEWLAWRSDCFSAFLMPAILGALTHARRGEARELQLFDQELNANLSGDARDRSSKVGRKLLRDLAAARAVSFVVRMNAAAEKDATPAHFAIVHAMQCALFHVPALPALLSYLFFEWQAADVTSSSFTFAELIETFRPVLAAKAGIPSDELSGQAAA